MRHARTLHTILWGLIFGVMVVTPDRGASADGPQLINMFQAAQPVATPTVKGWTRPARTPAGSGLAQPRPVMSGPVRANRAGSLIRPNGGNFQAESQGGGTKRSWDIVPKGSTADSGGSWVIAPKPKWTGVGPVGNKSPGQGSAPSSMAFPEPTNNGPKRTSSTATHVRAPEANPPSSTRVRAPSAPDPAPAATPNPTPGPQNPGGPSAAPGQGGATLGDWVNAAGAIVDMANSVMGNGNMGYGNMGYGDTGYGDTGGSYTYPASNAVYEDSCPSNVTGAVVSEVPANPSPIAQLHIGIVNPAENGVALQFLLDGQLQTLEAGTRVDFTAVRPVEIKFDRGEQFGRGRYKLTEYLYTFRPSDHGWELYRSQYVTPTQQ